MYLQATGGFQSKVVGQVNDLAACQPTPGSEWILGKILGYDAATGLYTVADEDTESNKGKLRKSALTIKATKLHVCDVLIGSHNGVFYN